MQTDEDRPQYVIDALEMAGLNEPQKIETQISGYVPVFDALLAKYDNPITPLVFGRMWLYCNMIDRVCRAALATIGEGLNLDASTVSRHAEKLVADGFLIDLTPTLKNRPHVYADAGRVVMKNALNAHLAESKASLAQNKADLAQNRLSTLSNTPVDNKDVAKAIQNRTSLLVKLYRENIGEPTPLMADILRNAVIDYPVETWYQPAFEIAVIANARKWNYVAAVLDGWKNNGFGWKPEKYAQRRAPKTPTGEPEGRWI